jgi:hypothetical protein
MLVINIIMSFRTPTPVGVGGVFLCRALSIRNKCVLSCVKKIFSFTNSRKENLSDAKTGKLFLTSSLELRKLSK